MKKIKEILIERIKQKGLSSQVDSAGVCMMAREGFPDEFSPVSYRKGILKVACPDHILAGIYRLRREEIIEEINKKTGLAKVNKIVFVVKN